MSLVTWHGIPQPKLIWLHNHHFYIKPQACDNPLDAVEYDTTVNGRTWRYFTRGQHIKVGDRVKFLTETYLVTGKLTEYTGQHSYDRAKFALRKIK